MYIVAYWKRLHRAVEIWSLQALQALLPFTLCSGGSVSPCTELGWMMSLNSWSVWWYQRVALLFMALNQMCNSPTCLGPWLGCAPLHPNIFPPLRNWARSSSPGSGWRSKLFVIRSNAYIILSKLYIHVELQGFGLVSLCSRHSNYLIGGCPSQ